MTLVDRLSSIVGDAFEKSGIVRTLGEVAVSNRPDLSQFQCNGALPAAKVAGRNPRELAQEIVDQLAGEPAFASVSLAGPGFINITLTDDVIGEYVLGIAADDRLGMPALGTHRVLVDYGGPNVAKNLHVGHLRPAIIGESLKRIARFAGYDALGDVHLGDWGLPMGQLIAELELARPDLPYFDESFSGPYPSESPVTMDDLEVMYPAAATRAKTDDEFLARTREATAALQAGRPGYRALWAHFRSVSIVALKSTFDRLGVGFELWHGEATVHNRIEPMIEKVKASGHAIESDGALVVFVERPEDNKEIPPLMLVNSRGAYTYGTSDLATVDERVADLGVTEMIYVVDQRQALHFEQVFRAAYLTGIATEQTILEHAGNGTVNGPDGKPFRTRDGDLPSLGGLIDAVHAKAMERLDENDLASDYPPAERDEIAELVGLAALKYGELSNHRASNYIFDLDRFTSFQGKTGPYLLYGAVRMKSILRNAAEAGLAGGDIIPPTVDAERTLMLSLARLPEVIKRAMEFRAPNNVAEYVYDIVTDFNRFYEECHILSEPDGARQASWLGLVDLTRRQVERLLDLLGVTVPERM